MTEPAREWKGVMSWIKQNGFHEGRNWRIWYEDDGAYTLWLCAEDPTTGENALVATLKTSDEAKSLAQRLQDVLDGGNKADAALREIYCLECSEAAEHHSSCDYARSASVYHSADLKEPA